MNSVENILLNNNIIDFAFVDFKSLELFDVKSKERVPEGAKTAIACIFPYYSKEALNGNISAYSAVQDYHIIIKEKLNEVCLQLSDIYASEQFVAFVDASPVNEVDMCLKAGLGVLGKQALLLSEKHGSFVFIGEIITTLQIQTQLKEAKNCIGCNLCIKNCPGKAISESGVNTQNCASYLTQKKGELTPQEIAIIRKAGLVWGCDMCQLVCPYNKDIKQANNEFSEGIINKIERHTVQGIYKGRAFGFKGLKILLRNFSYFEN